MEKKIMIAFKHKSVDIDKCINRHFSDLEDIPYTVKLSSSTIWGQTLEIIAVPNKVCPGDCLYCPYGKTTYKTVDRQSFYSIKKTMDSIGNVLKENPTVEHIVISGPGEVALNADLNWLIDNLKKITSIPIAINSCGSLCWRISVYKDFLKANAVSVNIDAADRSTYHTINRFHQQIPFDRYMAGITDFRTAYSGDFYVRVCLLDGINTSEFVFYKLVSQVKSLCPKAILVSTSSAIIDKSKSLELTSEELEKMAVRFGPSAQVINADSTILKSVETNKSCKNSGEYLSKTK
jgi:wyosine [tRNA(Phe)-imidazoG37] synthetase (radical SAM superfamily)